MTAGNSLRDTVFLNAGGAAAAFGTEGIENPVEWCEKELLLDPWPWLEALSDCCLRGYSCESRGSENMLCSVLGLIWFATSLELLMVWSATWTLEGRPAKVEKKSF